MSRNEWIVKGIVEEISERKKGAVITLKGNVYRTNLCSFSLQIDCCLNKELWGNVSMLHLRKGSIITLAGNLHFGRDTYLVTDKLVEVKYVRQRQPQRARKTKCV